MPVPYLDTDQPIAFAHRGGAFDGIENSLEAFVRCVDLGYGYIETDVHASKDGVVVAVHDPTLDRTTDVTGAVSDLTWEEISKAKIGGRGTIPTLERLLEEFPNTRFNIDAKADSVVVPLAHLLLGRPAADLDRVCLGSFSDRRLRRLRALLGPRVATSMAPLEAAALRAASYGGRPGKRLRLRGDCAQLPAAIRGRQIVDARLIDTAHDLGKQVHVWTIDDPIEMNRLLDLGVDGIMTDRPELLKQVLMDRAQWSGAV